MSIKEYSFPMKELCEKCNNRDLCSMQDECHNSVDGITERSIRDECEGFYKIFRELVPICFFRTDISEIGIEKFRENDKLFAPCIVNGAFAVELALKYLIYKDSSAFVRCHDLAELFKRIPEGDHVALLKKLQNGKMLPGSTMESNIDALKNSFEKWRYSFEFSGISIDIFFKTFVCTICEYVVPQDGGNK